MSRRAALMIAPLLLLALAGCVDTPPTIDETATAGYTPTPTPATPTPTASATPDATSEPFSIACGDLITADQVYEYNPNFGAVDGWVPNPGTVAGDGVAAQGTACRWQNQSSGATIDVSVAHLLEPRLSEKKGEVAATYATADWPIEGYFLANGGPGIAQAFTDKYWVTVQSTTFFAAEDVAPLIEYLSASLG